MKFYKTIDDEKLLRIEDEEGSAITVAKDGDEARILSLMVQKADRREGLGKKLLLAAESEMYSLGKKSIASFYSDISADASGFFGACGYEVSSVAPVVSVLIITDAADAAQGA